MPAKIEMTFVCDQDWNEMKISEQGRYCEMCRKTVHDFTDKRLETVPKSNGEELCGMFRIEQIETDLIPVEIPFSIRHTVLTIGAVLGLELTQAHGQELNQRPKVEHVMNDSTDANRVVVVAKGNELKADLQDCKEVKRPIRRKYYLTKRFPFIVKRRVRLGGRYRH